MMCRGLNVRREQIVMFTFTSGNNSSLLREFNGKAIGLSKYNYGNPKQILSIKPVRSLRKASFRKGKCTITCNGFIFESRRRS